MMTNLAQYLSVFLREYLPLERRASIHTCETYAYTFQLLINFAANQLKLPPSKLTIEQLNIKLIVNFLNYLETERGNSARTRNARSAAIKAFFRFLEYRAVSSLEQCRQIHAIPVKKTDDKLVNYLTAKEMQIILDAPNISTLSGIRDRAMIYLCFAAGLRVSELVELYLNQLELYPQPTIHVIGKGRKERVLPLWKETAIVLKAWIAVRPDTITTPELFLNAQGRAMTRSGFEYILAKHVKKSIQVLPSLAKKRISPHVLRHSCAMQTLKATHDIRKVSLWLGHADLKSTEIYLRADPDEKLESLMAVVPPNIKKGKFKAPDKLLIMLQAKNYE
jgi:site-specific recombinase XerD